MPAHTWIDQTATLLRRTAECVLLALGVPVTRDMPADAAFLPMERDEAKDVLWREGSFLLNGVNPATGLPLVAGQDGVGNPWGQDHR